MPVNTAAGTVVAISAAKPTAFTEAAYKTLTYSAIGEITDAGSHGRTYALVSHNAIATRGTQKFKGSYNEGTKTLQLAVDRKDPGQVIAKAAVNSDADYSFKVTYPGGDIDYFSAKVMSFVTNTSGVDSMLDGSIELEITTSKEGIGIIEVAAPVVP